MGDRDDDLDWSYEKHARWVIYGPAVAPELAWEIIRRTDGFFCSEGSLSPYGRNVRRLVGLPSLQDFRDDAADGKVNPNGDYEQAFFRALRRYVTAWGVPGAAHPSMIPVPMILANHMVSVGRGWCYPDGTIAMVGEVERGYPEDMLAECQLLAAAFPELRLSIALWGRAQQDAPTLGFKVAGGRATAIRGEDPSLFGDYGRLMYWSTVSSAADKAVRGACESLTLETRFGDRTLDGPGGHTFPGLPDEVVDSWIEKARSLHLVT